MKTLKDDLIKRLQAEIAFLRTANVVDINEHYHYELNGDLSESGSC